MALCIIDLIAIPDFSAGAMENWGLITYRLTSLLYDEGKSSDSNKQWVAVVVAHELAHQVCLFYKQKKRRNKFQIVFIFISNFPWIKVSNSGVCLIFCCCLVIDL